MFHLKMWLLTAFLLAISLVFCEISGPRSICTLCNCSENALAEPQVDCRRRSLQDIPSGIPYSTVVLYLNPNEIVSVTRDALRNLDRLERLYLSHNRLQTIAPHAFNALRSLKTLTLNNNGITGLPPSLFSATPHLSSLILSNNQIRSLPSALFTPLTNLHKLNLERNSMTKLSANLGLQHLRHLHSLHLDRNPLLCDCEMTWIIDVIGHIKRMDRGEFSGTCERPTSLARSDMTHLTRDQMCHSDRSAGYQNDEERRNYPPRITTIPETQTVLNGTSLILYCQADGNPSPVIEWFINESPVRENRRNIFIRNDGAIIIDDVDYRRHAGVYRCTATNSNGQDSRQATVNVKHSPELTAIPQNRRVGEHGHTELVCDGIGVPAPSVEWYRNGELVLTNSNFVLSLRGTKLTINNVGDEEVGTYKCVVSNGIGRSVSAEARLEVVRIQSARLTRVPISQEARLGDTVRFHCAGSGDPTPVITWQFDGTTIAAVRGHIEIRSDNTLTINEVVRSDAGSYRCFVSNEAGTQAAFARLTVLGAEAGPVAEPDVDVVSPNSPISSAKIREIVNKATSEVNSSVNRTIDVLHSGSPKSPAKLLSLFRYPGFFVTIIPNFQYIPESLGPEARELAKATEIYERTLAIIKTYTEGEREFQDYGVGDFSYEKFLSEDHLRLISKLSGCWVHTENEPCNDMCFHLNYRTIDGTCNNLQHPKWGASLTPFTRLLPSIYENGFNTPVGWNPEKLYHGFRKPSARAVSVKIVSSSSTTDDNTASHMLMQWGQFLDHDMDFAVMVPSLERFDTGSDCEATCENEPPCFNIPIAPDDPRITMRRFRNHSSNGRLCMEFERSSAICGSGMTSVFQGHVMRREQINQITSFIDASNIYGSTRQDAESLRDLFTDHGLLKFGQVSHVRKAYLPFNRNTPMDCRRNSSIPQHVRCFLAGDYRANEHLGLLSMHTMFLREHNRIVTKLLKINPHWDGEKMYQEVRKIIGAYMQHISYKHWLPMVLGDQYIDRHIGEYRGYNPDTNPTIANAFATAAFRFGHTMINPVFKRLDSRFQTIEQGHISLHDAFFAPDKLLYEGGIDPLLRGLFASPAKMLTSDEFLNQDLTEKLFMKAEYIALDLAALNIQRGRDHAIPSYTQFRRWCNLTVPDSWNELRHDIPSARLRRKLEDLYGHPGNIDLWVGGLSEEVMPNARVGPTLGCIIANQFKRLRDGDRFWYENPGVFSLVQLAEVKKITLSRLICDNGDEFNKITENVFKFETPLPLVNCNDVPEINLNLWQECCSSCSSKTGDIENGDYDDVSPEEGVRKKRSTNTAKHCGEGAPNSQIVELSTKVHDLEKLLYDLSENLADFKQQRSSAKSCGDYLHNEEWLKDPCRRCKCEDGQIWCQPSSC